MVNRHPTMLWIIGFFSILSTAEKLEMDELFQLMKRRSEIYLNGNLAWMTSGRHAGRAVRQNCYGSLYSSSTNRERNPAWGIDLRQIYYVRHILVLASDQYKGAKEFRDAFGFLSFDKPNLKYIDFDNYCGSFRGPANVGQPIFFRCSRSGRYAYFALKGRGKKLYICHVEVYGYIVVNGGWASWKAWSSCTKSCGSGTKTRTRTCTNPSPQYGAECPGDAKETKNCNTHHCPINGGWDSWKAWSSCTKSCGSGTKTRTRTCTNPSPQYGGAECPGDSKEETSCNTHHCPIHGNWSLWGSWSQCSKSCGGGSRYRNRSCTNPKPQYEGNKCQGSPNATEKCNTQMCPIDGGFTEWSDYGSCSLSCGGGIQTRSRNCSNPTPKYGGKNCSGSLNEDRACNTHYCPIHGNWSEWRDWSVCSKACGGGEHRRTRICNNPRPKYNGEPCQGDSSETAPCNEKNCPIHGKWSKWGKWDQCNKSCGGGFIHQYRFCNNPPPQYGGRNCSGINVRIATCNEHNCSIDGNWGSWSSFSECSQTCGEGVKESFRFCDNPKPQYYGKECVGMSVKYEKCSNIQACPDEIKLTLTIGGQKIRENLFDAGTEFTCRASKQNALQFIVMKQICNGSVNLTATCQADICKIKLKGLQKYSFCTVDCDGKAFGGVNLPVAKDQREVCILPAWSDWSECSVECGVGWQTKQRDCVGHFGQKKGKVCSEYESQRCDTGIECPYPQLEEPSLTLTPGLLDEGVVEYIWDLTPDQN